MTMKKPVSPWPFAIVGLLVLNAAAAFLILFISRSDGGAQVVPDYYNRAVAWDSLASSNMETAATGWNFRIQDPNRSDSLVFVVVDAAGDELSGFSGQLVFSRPQYSAPIAIVPIAQNQPLAVDASSLPRGLYDVRAELRRGETDFRPTIRFDRVVARDNPAG